MKTVKVVKHVSLLAASLLMFAGAPSAQATSYSISATFKDGGTQKQTVFSGGFKWDGTQVTDFSGFLSESMWRWDSTLGKFKTGMGMPVAATYLNDVYAKAGGYQNNDAPLLALHNQLAVDYSDPNLVTATVFLKNSTDVVAGGGYDVNGNSMAYGTMMGDGARNYNGFFTLVFDKSNPTNTLLTTNSMVYGDFTRLGLMGPMLTGGMGMTGFIDGTTKGSMGGYPLSLSVQAVPVPAAAWLFGGALMSLFGANRRKSVLPA